MYLFQLEQALLMFNWSVAVVVAVGIAVGRAIDGGGAINDGVVVTATSGVSIGNNGIARGQVGSVNMVIASGGSGDGGNVDTITIGGAAGSGSNTGCGGASDVNDGGSDGASTMNGHISLGKLHATTWSGCVSLC